MSGSTQPAIAQLTRDRGICGLTSLSEKTWERLTIYWCQCKNSSFSSLILRPWVEIRPRLEPCPPPPQLERQEWRPQHHTCVFMVCIQMKMMSWCLPRIYPHHASWKAARHIYFSACLVWIYNQNDTTKAIISVYQLQRDICTHIYSITFTRITYVYLVNRPWLA